MPAPDRALIAGIPELLILQLLARRPMYGYELAKTIRLVSREALALGEGVLYPTLHVLEQRGLLRTRERTVDGRSRIYYEPTARGVKRLASLTAEWRRIASGVESVLGSSDA